MTTAHVELPRGARPGGRLAIADDDPRVLLIALERAKSLGAPMVVSGMIASFVLSVPSGVPLSRAVIISNLACIFLGLTIWLMLARDVVAPRWAHAALTATWLLAPLNTLLTMFITKQSELTYPFLLEVSLLCVTQVSPRWLMAALLVASAAWFPIALRTGGAHLTMQAACVAGLAVSAILITTRIRRSLDLALLREDEATRSAAGLARELEMREGLERERERLREQFVEAQRMEATATLAAGLAHDMNNILGGILAQSQILLDEPANVGCRSELCEIAKEAERGAQLTRSLLGYARKGQYERGIVALGESLAEVRPMLTRLLAKRATVEWSCETASFVDADPAELRQVLVNLCLNGADALDVGGVISIAVRDISLDEERAGALGLSPGEYVSFSVTDSGSGMTEAVRARIFEPFFTTKALGKGTGLGLAMAYGTIHAHGGAIEVDTELGRGTTFRVFLPSRAAALAAPPTTAAAPAPVVGPKRAASVALVVDDEQMIRKAVSHLLRQMQLTVVSASSGEEALAIFAERQDEVALVVLDMSMPGMGGAECFRRLRALKHVPVLVISGFAEGQATQELLAAGDTLFLEKPFRPSAFREKVNSVLSRG